MLLSSTQMPQRMIFINPIYFRVAPDVGGPLMGNKASKAEMGPQLRNGGGGQLVSPVRESQVITITILITFIFILTFNITISILSPSPSP